MKKIFLNNLFCLTVIFVGGITAQKDLPNFSGNWESDKKESTVYFFGREMPGFSSQLFNACSVNLVINHNDPELILKRTTVCQNLDNPKAPPIKTDIISRYFTDGRGEVNNSIKNETVESKTEWKKDKVLITVYRLNNKKGKKKLDHYEEIELSKDKEKLTRKIIGTETAPFSSQPSITKWVYKISK